MLLYFFICVWIVYVPLHTCMTECMCITRRASVEVRGQPYGLCSLFDHVGPGDQTPVFRLVSKHLYVLNWPSRCSL